MTPNKYEISVAVKQAKPGWNGNPAYAWFFNVDAGESRAHAMDVLGELRTKFPAPQYKMTLKEHYSYCEASPVDNVCAIVPG